MRSHNIDSIGGEFNNEHTCVPSGECEVWELGENCMHTDCPQCGREAAGELRADARINTYGVIALAQEAVYQDERYGVNLPDGVVTIGDLARLYDGASIPDHEAYAWAEGICEALSGTESMRAVGKANPSYKTKAENEAHAAGVALVAWWREDQRRQNDVATAQANVNAWESMGLPSPIVPSEFTPCTLREKARRLGIAYAAGSSESDEPPRRPLAGHGRAREAEPAFDSRAQHQAQPSKR